LVHEIAVVARRRGYSIAVGGKGHGSGSRAVPCRGDRRPRSRRLRRVSRRGAGAL